MQGMVAGPLAGFLFLVAASLPFFANAGTYAASAILIGLVAGVYRASPDPGAGSGDGSAAAARTGCGRSGGGGRGLPLAGAPAAAAHDGGPDRAAEPDAHRGGGGARAVGEGPASPRLGGLRPAVHVHGGGRHPRVGHRRPADQGGHRDLDDPDRPADRGRDAPRAGHLAQCVRDRAHAVRLRRARRAVEHRREFAAAAAHAAPHARPVASTTLFIAAAATAPAPC